MESSLLLGQGVNLHPADLRQPFRPSSMGTMLDSTHLFDMSRSCSFHATHGMSRSGAEKSASWLGPNHLGFINAD